MPILATAEIAEKQLSQTKLLKIPALNKKKSLQVPKIAVNHIFWLEISIFVWNEKSGMLKLPGKVANLI